MTLSFQGMTENNVQTNGAASWTMSPVTPELLHIIGSANQSHNQDSLIENLVAFRKKLQTPLSTEDILIAFQDCFLSEWLHTSITQQHLLMHCHIDFWFAQTFIHPLFS